MADIVPEDNREGEVSPVKREVIKFKDLDGFKRILHH